MNLWEWGRKALMTLPPEASHNLAVATLKVLGPRLNLNPAWAIQPVDVMGMQFRNSLGLAAGFDKNAEIVLAAAAMGFGFVEIGTVTPKAQYGNSKPRLFREKSEESLFNRMGFNNEGAHKVFDNLLESLRLLRSEAPLFRVGLSVGKNASTPIEKTHEDICAVAKVFKDSVDYIAVNVSSPNTPGLRSLQNAKDLTLILKSLKQTLNYKKPVPIILKLAPEITAPELKVIIEEVESYEGVQGYCLTNTLAGEFNGQRGGWSGARLAEKSKQSLKMARELTSKPIVSVGGIKTAQDILERKKMGAILFQSYTGFVFGGPLWPRKILSELKST
jgi:dihydroorotate dehydrogenase